MSREIHIPFAATDTVNLTDPVEYVRQIQRDAMQQILDALSEDLHSPLTLFPSDGRMLVCQTLLEGELEEATVLYDLDDVFSNIGDYSDEKADFEALRDFLLEKVSQLDARLSQFVDHP